MISFYGFPRMFLLGIRPCCEVNIGSEGIEEFCSLIYPMLDCPTGSLSASPFFMAWNRTKIYPLGNSSQTWLAGKYLHHPMCPWIGDFLAMFDDTAGYTVFRYRSWPITAIGPMVHRTPRRKKNREITRFHSVCQTRQKAGRASLYECAGLKIYTMQISVPLSLPLDMRYRNM